MMTTRNSSAGSCGIRQGVERKDRGTAITVPAQVPTRAMHTVSSSRYPKPLVSVSKKKAQSGWNRPEIMACTARGLIWEKSGGWRDSVQTKASRTAAPVRSRFPRGDRLRSSRMIWDSRLLIPSMTQTVRNRKNRIMPTLPYSSHEIFSFSSRPMPPAPT